MFGFGFLANQAQQAFDAVELLELVTAGGKSNALTGRSPLVIGAGLFKKRSG